MSGSRSFITAYLVARTKCNHISDLELRLMKISAEKTMKHCEGAAKVSTITSEMDTEVEAIKAKYSDSTSSEDYKQCLQEVESKENEYMVQIQVIQDQMEEAEEKIETQQNTAETELEAERADYDEWRKLANEKAGNAGYFNSGGA